MSPQSTMEALLAATEPAGIDRADLEAACHLIHSSKLSVKQAAAILLDAENAATATPSLQPTPTLAELLEAWGPPPRAVLEDWVEQIGQQLFTLERRAAEHQLPPPGVAEALTLEAIRVDSRNRLRAIELDALHRTLINATASSTEDGSRPEQGSLAKFRSDYQKALHAFAQQIDPSYSESFTFSPAGTADDGADGGGEPTGENRSTPDVGAGEIALNSKSRRKLKQDAAKPCPRRPWRAGAVLGLFTAVFALIVLRRGEPPERLETSSTAQLKDPVETPVERGEPLEEKTREFGSFESDAAPQAEPPAENHSRALLNRLDNLGGDSWSPSETIRFGDGSDEADDPRASGERSRSASDGSSQRDSENNAGADATSAVAAEPSGEEELDLETAIDAADERPAPIADEPLIDAVILPPLANDDVSVRLHPKPAEKVSLEFLGPLLDGEPRRASAPPLRLVVETEPGSDLTAAWRVVEAKEGGSISVVGGIYSDSGGTHFRWSPEAPQRLATDFRNGRLRLHFAEAPSRSLFLRAPQEIAPVDFDFEQPKLEVAWQLTTPPHPSASRLHIDFQLPESTTHVWIEPSHLPSTRRLVAIAELTSDESEFVALRMRFDLQTGRRLVCRVRYAARLDATLPWRWVTMPAAIEEADHIAAQHLSTLAILRQIDAIDGRRGDRNERALRDRRREALEQRSKQLATLAERLDHLIQWMHNLQQEGQIGWRIITEWPDRPQAIFATPFHEPSIRSSN